MCEITEPEFSNKKTRMKGKGALKLDTVIRNTDGVGSCEGLATLILRPATMVCLAQFIKRGVSRDTNMR
jgi:hypothetical protein